MNVVASPISFASLLVVSFGVPGAVCFDSSSGDSFTGVEGSFSFSFSSVSRSTSSWELLPVRSFSFPSSTSWNESFFFFCFSLDLCVDGLSSSLKLLRFFFDRSFSVPASFFLSVSSCFLLFSVWIFFSLVVSSEVLDVIVIVLRWNFVDFVNCKVSVLLLTNKMEMLLKWQKEKE